MCKLISTAQPFVQFTYYLKFTFNLKSKYAYLYRIMQNNKNIVKNTIFHIA